MKNLYTDTRILDKAAREKFFLTEEIMMENAAIALENAVISFFKAESNIFNKTVLILTGPGNNGADGMVLARRLKEKASVKVIHFGKIKTPLCELQKERAEKVGVKIEVYNQKQQIPQDTAVIVDCIFGAGFSGKIADEYEEFFDLINNYNAYKIACDIPSGLDKDGNIYGKVFYATETITMGALKKALYSDDAKDVTGKITIADLGISNSLFEKDSTEYAYILEKTDLELPFRKKQNTHKGSYGHVAIIAGEKPGAAVIAGKAAFSFGAGLVTLTRKEYQDLYKNIPYELMQSEKLPENTTAIAVGMGLGRNENNYTEALTYIEKSKNTPLIIDADFFYYKDLEHFINTYNKNRFLVLTPHPKEYKELLQTCKLCTPSTDLKSIIENKIYYGKEFCKKYPNTTLLIKGANPVIITQEEEIKTYINPCGNNCLAKGGSGDVLSGLIAALLAQGYDASKAVIQASLAHAIASQNIKNNYSMTPFDLIDKIANLDS